VIVDHDMKKSFSLESMISANNKITFTMRAISKGLISAKRQVEVVFVDVGEAPKLADAPKTSYRFEQFDNIEKRVEGKVKEFVSSIAAKHIRD
jgi:hypothetical protein